MSFVLIWPRSNDVSKEQPKSKIMWAIHLHFTQSAGHTRLQTDFPSSRRAAAKPSLKRNLPQRQSVKTLVLLAAFLHADFSSLTKIVVHIFIHFLFSHIRGNPSDVESLRNMPCEWRCNQILVSTQWQLFISSVRSSNSHPDLLLIHPPTFSDHTGPQHWTFTFWATSAI